MHTTMRSIWLLLPLISQISQIFSEDLDKKQSDKNEVKYAGPIVYSNEKPPIIIFPTPPTTSSTNLKSNGSTNKNNIEYIPFPYQELPVLIYKSKDNPPVHLVSDSKSNDNLDNVTSNIEKRLGDINMSANQRGSRALKWSNFKLFNDMPLVMKAPKWSTNEQKNLNPNIHSLTQSLIDINNNSLLTASNNPLTLSNAPHVVYSGHPPIHVFPQPIIIKEPELTEMTSASEAFSSFKKPNNVNAFDMTLAALASNKHEVSTNPSSTQFYSYTGGPANTGSNGKSYGFRVKTKGNKHDTEYSSSQNYENYDEAYSQPLTDGSSDSQSEDNTKYKASSSSSGSSSSDSSQEPNDKEYEKDSYNRERQREKYPKYTPNNWLPNDWDPDSSWLSSLLGYNRWPRPRKPMTLSVVNSPTNDHLVFATPTAGHYDFDSMGLMRPHIHPNAWVHGMTGLRPTSSAIRPVYTSGMYGGGMFGYRRPQVAHPPQHPTPQLYARINPGLPPASSNLAPIALKHIGLGPQLMGLPSVTYPVRMPVSPFMMYGYRRPPIGTPSGDLAFAESTRNTTNSANIKWTHLKDDMQMSASQARPTFVLPSPAKPTSITNSVSTVAQNKPPIIIYQGLRPPVHVYKQPTISITKNSEPMTASDLQEVDNIQTKTADITSDSTITSSTENPFYQLYSTEETGALFDDNNYKSGSAFYIGDNSAFSPRQTTGEWVPIKQTNDDKDNDHKN